MTAQVAGVITGAVGATLLWSPWALVIAAALLLIVPEMATLRRRP